jgi:hypothetical protein
MRGASDSGVQGRGTGVDRVCLKDRVLKIDAFAPSGLVHLLRSHPRLAPWAALLRRFAAAIQRARHSSGSKTGGERGRTVNVGGGSGI